MKKVLATFVMQNNFFDEVKACNAKRIKNFILWFCYMFLLIVLFAKFSMIDVSKEEAYLLIP